MAWLMNELRPLLLRDWIDVARWGPTMEANRGSVHGMTPSYVLLDGLMWLKMVRFEKNGQIHLSKII
jgi:hypothetical protein